MLATALFLATLLPGHTVMQKSAFSAARIHFAIVFIGGPDPQGEGKNILNQFLANLSKISGISRSRLAGHYFNSLPAAKAYIRRNRNCFIVGSIGFFAANRRSMNLVPLAKVSMQGSDREQYFLVVKKGRYRNLQQMKGKKISGNVLYESSRFLSNIVFQKRINVRTYFRLKPTHRPLTAVRRVSRGRVDGVLLNRMQYNSLKRLAMFRRLQVAYRSPRLPALGLMMVNTPVNRAEKGKLLKALTGLCRMPEGQKVCKNFGIQGFNKVTPGEVERAVASY